MMGDGGTRKVQAITGGGKSLFDTLAAGKNRPVVFPLWRLLTIGKSW